MEANPAKKAGLLRNSVALAPDGFHHPVKKLKGSFFKKEKEENVLHKRVAWADSDVKATDVDWPDLPCRGYVNPKRVVMDYRNVPEREEAVIEKNPSQTCQFCEQVFSQQSTCLAHEPKCQAHGGPRHRCGPLCQADCKGCLDMKDYVPPPDRRRNNLGRPRK
ncbi:uncharacterized protein LOC141857473 [Brevipalpus obovatus]|uniref:uncharacterized protein LOC141857473 n=1 Tax=Brevipalpus obovatus TaxID=246614 RepID=UPI003D9DC4E4